MGGLAKLTNPMGWVKAGLSFASTVGIGYVNYQSGKSQARLKKKKQEWELLRSAIEQLNGLRRELKDKDQDDELQRQAQKDEEHDRKFDKVNLDIQDITKRIELLLEKMRNITSK